MELNVDALLVHFEVEPNITAIAKQCILEWGKGLFSQGYERGWGARETMQRGLNQCQRTRMKNVMLNCSEDGRVDELEVIRFALGVKDELTAMAKSGTKEMRTACIAIDACVDNHFMNMRLDHRALFKKDEYYREAIKVIAEILRTDTDCRIEWVINIEKAYITCEEEYRKRTKKKYLNLEDKHTIASEAVESFMKTFFKECKDKYEKIPITLRELQKL